MQLSSARLGTPSNGLQTPEGRDRTSCPTDRPDIPTSIPCKSVSFDMREGGGLPLDGGPSRIPLSAALLAWRLLIARSGEEDAVDVIAIGRRPTQPAKFPPSAPSTPTFQVTIPKPPLAVDRLVAEACDEIYRGLEQSLQQSYGQLGTEVGIDTTLCISDASTSEHVGQHRDGNGFDAQQSWRVCLQLAAVGDELRIAMQWQSSYMTETRAENGLHLFTLYLAAILEETRIPAADSTTQQPSRKTVWDLIGPSAEDLNQIWMWNATVPPIFNRCIHDLVSDRCVVTPDKVAVEAWDGTFTYREIDALSTILARQLRSSAGVRVGDIVVLVFEKSRWTTPALLGVLKAGAAFALTDPSQPEARLRNIVAQTRARAVVSSEQQFGLANRISQDASKDNSGKPAKILVASDATLLEHAGWGAGASAIYLPVVPPSSPMYVIFTSGSTGTPKGVVCSHANFVSGAVPRAEAVGYKSSSRVFEFASYAFDVSIDCMLCTLMVGGTVCVPSEAGRVDDLSAAILASGANMAHMTPSVARVLSDPERVMRALDVLGLGGEAVSAGDAAAWSKLTKVIIAYGPSECTVGCTINDEVCAANTTIGKGKGATTWIVDPEDHDRLMPVGSVGELLVEGPVVGLGYLGQPDKTAEVFVSDPTWLVRGYAGKAPGRKGLLYKTGDLVKYDPNGFIVFVGRKDQQVKLRGQRVELSEIEHHLRGKLPHGVKIAAEVIKPGGGDPTLVAFVSEPLPTSPKLEEIAKKTPQDATVRLSPDLATILADMDSLLGEELPRYMVPTAYIPLQDMPTLPSAKTDRKKLRALGNAMSREDIAKLRLVYAVSTKPTTDTEKALHGLWRRILNTALEIGLEDSFFGVGGDSLRAMKLVSAARAEGIILTVADVFNHHTLKSMAAVAVVDKDCAMFRAVDVAPFSLLPSDWDPESARKDAAALCEDIDESMIEDMYPCTPLQEGLMALSAKFQDSYVAQRVLQLADAAGAKRLGDAFESACRDCAIMRTRIVQVPGRGLQQVVIGEPSIRWRYGKTVEEYLETDHGEHMDLGKSLVRYGLVHHADGTAAFILTIHHALYDGWSMPLVIDRVNRAYDGKQTERPAEFKHFIKFLETADREACEAYWRQRLDGATGLQFPPLPYEGYTTQANSLLELHIPVAARDNSHSSVPTSTAAITMATIFRGAWALVASQYVGGADDVVFGETLTGRNAPVAGADLIEGPMITTVPVRVRIDKHATAAEYLAAIQDEGVRQMEYEHTGLQHIRRLSPDALEACELRTGLVLHPPAGEGESPFDRSLCPAERLMPANDAGAAREALAFNTFALMLVCSLAADGFFVMASFDSNTVDERTMERVLQRLNRCTAELCRGLENGTKVAEVLTSVGFGDVDDEFDELVGLSKNGADGLGFDKPEHIWLVDLQDSQRLVPRGAVGEILVDSSTQRSLPSAQIPDWYTNITSEQPERAVYLHTTGQLGRYDGEGKLVVLGRKEDRTPSSKGSPNSNKATEEQSSSITSVLLSSKESNVRELWARILHMEAGSIAREDSFFRLGGDSIAAMKLVSEARLAGLKLTVAQIFKTKTLAAMAEMAEELPTSITSDQGPAKDSLEANTVPVPFSLLEVSNVSEFLERQIQPRLANKHWKIDDVLPTRPLQAIAVKGSTDKPRFSIRYEALYFDDNTGLDKAHLIRSCQELVLRNEILRTVFVSDEQGACYGVVLENLVVNVEERVLPQDGSDIQAFVHQLCNDDIEGSIPEGSAFVKFFLVEAGSDVTSRGALVMRISHAQYDEICLPLLLRQLAALYKGDGSDAAADPLVPFSTFVDHTLRVANPASAGYWADLLAGSPPPTVLRPGRADVPACQRAHFAVQRTVDVSAAASPGVTAATFPTAAWALCLARRTGRRDVLFGEVVSGRGGLARAGLVAGPCWQYVPFRVRLSPGDTPTGAALLELVQAQHAAGSAHEGMALPEIASAAGLGWEADWFDTVVHQDVEHVEDLGFGAGGAGGAGGLGARTETIYPHQEPLREWKVQAFVAEGERRLTMEIVTFEAWREEAVELLDELMGCVEELVYRPDDPLVFP
ncbi:hypothetical protein RB595_000315 [Gaeumannomyces hyphopodioides]